MQDLRTRITIAVQELFLRDGIDGVTMRKVADRVGVTAPAIYRHFKDKDELLNEIIIAGLRILDDYLKPALVADSPCARLRALIDRYVDFAIEQPSYFDFAFMVPSRKMGGISEEIEKHNWTTFGAAVEQVAMCVASGDFRQADPIETAIMIWATVHGLVTLHRVERFGQDPELFRATYRATVERLFDCLRPVAPISESG